MASIPWYGRAPWLENQGDMMGERFHFREQPGRTDKDGGVQIMAAGVHDTVLSGVIGGCFHIRPTYKIHFDFETKLTIKFVVEL